MRRIVTAFVAATVFMSLPTALRAQETPVTPVEAPAVQAMTFAEACCALKCLPPGEHRICFIHPYTCCPVEVCFCLPCGCYELCCKDGCFAKKLVFKYPGLCNDVVIKFKKNGDVAVN